MGVNVKELRTLRILVFIGWAVAAYQTIEVGDFKQRAEHAEGRAANWKRQAGKAYTDYLTAKAGPGMDVDVPMGVRTECNVKKVLIDGKNETQCVGTGVYYPPVDY